MPESNDDDIDRAYRTAVETTEDVAARRRRTSSVLAAVKSLEAAQTMRGERHGGQARLQVSTGWWRGLAAACVIGASALVTVHLSESPETIVPTEVRSDDNRAELADRAGPTSTPDPTRSRAEEPRPSSTRPERSSAKSRESLAGEQVLPAPAAQAMRGGLPGAATVGDIEATRRALQTTHPDAERDADGRTALAIAVLRSNVPLAKLLLGSGANPDLKDRFGQTPRTYAESVGDASMLQALGMR